MKHITRNYAIFDSQKIFDNVQRDIIDAFQNVKWNN